MAGDGEDISPSKDDKEPETEREEEEKEGRKEGGSAISATTPTTGSLVCSARSLARPHIAAF